MSKGYYSIKIVCVLNVKYHKTFYMLDFYHTKFNSFTLQKVSDYYENNV